MILTTLVAAVALGIMAQIVAERFQLPAILPLLVLGIFLGPAGLALFEPHSLGEVLEVGIHLGVAIILFEGGLSLDPKRLMKVGDAVRNLLTIGVLVTALGSAFLANRFLGLPWQVAALFGAIMTVTGPTVIVPLLRHMIAPQRAKTVLLSEGLIIDPIGAVLAYIVLQWIDRAGVPLGEIGAELLSLTATGAILGFVAGAVSKVVVRTRVVGGELRNLTILALLLVCYLVSEHQAPQSGILAAVVMGFTMSASELPDLSSLKAFKGQLTTLVISVLFILLAGQLDPAEVLQLGWGAVAVVVGLILVVRPLSVLLSVWPGQMTWRERFLLGMTAPRGIVAAAVASLAARQMETLGVTGAGTLEGLVYLSILATGAWSTIMALFLPWALGFTRDPARRRAVIVGANPLSESIARLLGETGRTTVVVDSVRWRLDRMRSAGISGVCGDARDAVTYQEAGVQRDSLVVAATTNDELNLLVAELVHAEFGVEHPVAALQRPPDDLGRRSRAWLDLLGHRAVDVPAWIKRIESGTVDIVEINATDKDSVARLREVERENPRGVLRLAGRDGDELTLRVSPLGSGSLDSVILLVAEPKLADRLGGTEAEPTAPPIAETVTT